MKRLAPLLLFVPLLLASCSSESTPAENSPAVASDNSSSTSTETSSTPIEEPAIAEIGDTIPKNCEYNDCIGEITITDISIGEECNYGAGEYLADDDAEKRQGKEILQIWGEYSLTKGPSDLNGGTINASVDGPSTVIDSEGFVQNLDSYQCNPSNEGHEYWESPIDSGQKIRIYGDFLVPTGATAIIVEEYTIPLPGRTIPEDVLNNIPSKSDLEPVDPTKENEHTKDYELIDSLGSNIGLYFDKKENNYLVCDFRGVVSLDILNSDGCSDAMDMEALMEAYAISWGRDEGLTLP